MYTYIHVFDLLSDIFECKLNENMHKRLLAFGLAFSFEYLQAPPQRGEFYIINSFEGCFQECTSTLRLLPHIIGTAFKKSTIHLWAWLSSKWQ